MKRFQYHQPKTFDEATTLLRRYNGAANLLAGGTDLLVEMKERLRHCDHVIDLKKIPEMTSLDYDDQQGLRFGALVTAREIETTPSVCENYPALAQAVRELGSIQVRNRATIVGNICRASPSADTLPPLIAGDARVRLRGSRGERMVALEHFFVGPGRTVLAADEIVIEIRVPPPRPASGSAYIKFGRRKAMELATVGVAVMLELEGAICRDIRIVLGAVAPTPIRAKRAEDALRGRLIERETIEAVGRHAMSVCRPISNVRASSDYRRAMVGVLTGRAIKQAAAMEMGQ
jgi:carbon-monoxide dehydrogenase medium subunit